MIGGTVIEVAPVSLPESGRDVVRLWCVDKKYSDECAVYTKPAAELPVPGDFIWWQGGTIYWTAADRRFVERELPKVGYSFDPRPRQETAS